MIEKLKNLWLYSVFNTILFVLALTFYYMYATFNDVNDLSKLLVSEPLKKFLGSFNILAILMAVLFGIFYLLGVSNAIGVLGYPDPSGEIEKPMIIKVVAIIAICIGGIFINTILTSLASSKAKGLDWKSELEIRKDRLMAEHLKSIKRDEMRKAKSEKNKVVEEVAEREQVITTDKDGKTQVFMKPIIKGIRKSLEDEMREFEYE